MGFSHSSVGKESACNAGDPGSISGLGRSPGEGNCNPLQYFCLEKSHGQRSLADYSSWSHKSQTWGGFFTVWATREAKNPGVGSLSLLQGIFLILGLNWGLLNCRWILYARATREDHIKQKRKFIASYLKNLGCNQFWDQLAPGPTM